MSMVDKHVVKMILESAQLLSSALVTNSIEAPYKLTHKNHPSAIWTRQSIHHYDWLLEHLKALCYEFFYRYDKIHKTESLINIFLDKRNELKNRIGSKDFVNPPLAMPEVFQIGDTISSYRYYYKSGKKHLHDWKRRSKPSWI